MGKDLNGRELGKGIIQRKSGRFEARFTDRYGKRHSLYAKTWGDAKELLRGALKADAEKNEILARYLLRDWYEEWMKIYKAPVIRPGTKNCYEQIFKKHILPPLGDLYLDEVQPFNVQKLINSLNEQGYMGETQSKVRLLLMDLFNLAMENGYAVKNPTRGVRLKKKKHKKRIVLTVEEQEEFLTCAAGTFYENFFVVALNTGLRPGEMYALTEDVIDFKKKTITVNRTLHYKKLDGDDKKKFHFGPPKTEAGNRTVPINDQAEEALRRQIVLKKILSHKHPKEGDFSAVLFVTKNNAPMNSQILKASIKRIVNEINLQRDPTDLFPEFSGHTFRHTFATRWIENGGQPKALQVILGHATLERTMNLYVHVTDSFGRDEMARLEDRFPKAKITSLMK